VGLMWKSWRPGSVTVTVTVTMTVTLYRFIGYPTCMGTCERATQALALSAPKEVKEKM
jgi:hypothetical protein